MMNAPFMKTLSLPMLALSGLTVTAHAQGAKPKTPPSPKTIVCAVMPQMKVDIARAEKGKLFADHKGRRYYFCCGGCPGEFRKNPAKFEKNPSLPIPKK